MSQQPHPPRPAAVRRCRVPLATAACLALAVVLAACGSGSRRDKPASAADAAFKFSRCMRAHGIKSFPDPQVSGRGVKLTFKAKAGGAGGPLPQQMEAAQNACKHFQAASAPKLTPQEKVVNEEAVLKFASCMRSHGIDVHASTAGGGMQIRVGADGPGKRGPNPESPAFTAAQKACQGLLPMKGGGGPGVSSGKGAGPSAGVSLGG
jgi:hypothetical protein